MSAKKSYSLGDGFSKAADLFVFHGIKLGLYVGIGVTALALTMGIDPTPIFELVMSGVKEIGMTAGMAGIHGTQAVAGATAAQLGVSTSVATAGVGAAGIGGTEMVFASMAA